MNTKSQIRNHIEQLNSLFESQNQLHPAYKILLEFGKDYAPKNHTILEPLKNQLCYMNAYDVMNCDLAYCEGLAMTNIRFPLSHAWLVDPSGQVTDPTWDHGEGYFGVVFESDFVYEMTDRTGYYSVFESLYMLKMSPEVCYEYLKTGVKRG